jgi:ATP-binding cassette subfamily B protein
MKKQPKKTTKPNLFALLKPYRNLVLLLVLFTLLSNGLSLIIPKIISSGIDSYTQKQFAFFPLFAQFTLVTGAIFIFTYIQNLVQTYVSEKVAKDVREKLANKISRQSYTTIQQTTPAILLTNLTSDVDAIKMFVAQAIASLIASILLILGASTLLLMTDWMLALAVLTIVPIIGGTFYLVLGKIRALFKKSQEIIDWLNKVINESILGAALIRVLNSQTQEYDKFKEANSKARDLGLKILSYFASLIPVITFVSSTATVIILALGGHFVITGSMTLGDIAAFNSYVMILIFPILMIGFMSGVIARANASYERINQMLNKPEKEETGTVTEKIQGAIELKDVSLNFGEKQILKHISFSLQPGTRTAIIGPTAAGKTQLLYLLSGLERPTSGTIYFDKRPLEEYESNSLQQQIGLVFQDSSMFNLSLRENIAFNDTVTDESLEKAITTAELKEFTSALPQKLNTIVSERGTSLSGGQKQRIMLARALALDPQILLLDDFTARVDVHTERNILANVKKYYPQITLLSITQKIASVQDYDQIILLMEGEIIAKGTHKQLLKTSPEYVQLYDSQRSTNQYELRTE